MLRRLAPLALLCGLALPLAGCAIYDTADLERGVAQGQVIDKIPSVNPDTKDTVWYIDVEDGGGRVTRFPVTYAAFQAVDTGDMLPDDLLEPLPIQEAELTPWR